MGCIELESTPSTQAGLTRRPSAFRLKQDVSHLAPLTKSLKSGALKLLPIRYGTVDFMSSGVGFGREATNWLTAKGVRLVGTDAWSWDAPFKYTSEAGRGGSKQDNAP